MDADKKGKKTKGKTLALSDFLQESAGSLPVQPIQKSNVNWAFKVESYYGSDACTPVNVVLPTAPKASRDYEDISDKVPKDPPYTAYISNLPYKVNEDEIASFFKNLKISDMTIPKDNRDVSKVKGFGYVEFEDRDDLIAALAIPDPTLKSRRIRIEVADILKKDRWRSRMNMSRERGDRNESSFGDWRSGSRSETSDSDRRSGFNKDRNGAGSGGFNTDNMKEVISYNRDNLRGGDRDDSRALISRDNMRYRDNAFSRDRDNEEGFNWRDREGLYDRLGGCRDDERSNRDQGRGFTGNFRDSDRGSRFEDRNEGRYDTREFGDRLASSEPRERPKLAEAETSEENSERRNIEKTRPAKKIENRPKRSEYKSLEEMDYEQRREKQKKEDKRGRHEKKLPKLSKPEPPNFVANNKFALLQIEDNCD